MSAVHPEPAAEPAGPDAGSPSAQAWSPKLSPFLRQSKSVNTGKVTAICTPHKDAVEGSKQHLRYAYGYMDGEVRIVDLPHPASPLPVGHVVLEARGAANVRVCGMAFHPKDPKVLVTGMSDGKIVVSVLKDRIWTLQEFFVGGSSESGRHLARQDTVARAREGLALAFTGDGSHLVVAHSGKLFLVDAKEAGGDGWTMNWDKFRELGTSGAPESLAVQPQVAGRSPQPLQVACSDGKSIRVLQDVFGVGKEDSSPAEDAKDLTGHTRSIHCLAYSPGNGELLASSSTDSTIRIWEAASLQTLDVLIGHQGRVETIAFQSPELLVSGSVDRTIRIWEVKRGECICVLKADEQVSSLCTWQHLDGGITGDMVLSGTYTGSLAMWETSSGTNVHVLPSEHNKHVQQVAMAGNHAVASFEDGKLLTWNLRGESGMEHELTETRPEILYAVTMSPDGTRIASGGEGRRIAVWHLSAGGEWEFEMELLHKFNEEADKSKDMRDIYGLAISPTGRYLASAGEDRWLRIWDLQALAKQDASERKPEVMILHDGGMKRIHHVAFHPGMADEATVRVVTSVGSGLVRMFEVTGLGGEGSVGTREYTNDTDTQLRLLWEGKGHTHMAHCVAFSRKPGWKPESASQALMVASASFDNTVKVWDAGKGHCLATLQLEGHKSGVKSCTWSPDGRYLASCQFDGLVVLWGPFGGDPAKTTMRHAFYGGSHVTWVSWESMGGDDPADHELLFAYSTDKGDVRLVDTSFIDQDFLPYAHASRFLDTEDEAVSSVFTEMVKACPYTLVAAGQGDGTLLHQLIKKDSPKTLGTLLGVVTEDKLKLMTTRTTAFRLEHVKKTIQANPLRAARASKPCAEKLVDALLEQNTPKAFSTVSGAEAMADLACYFPDLATKVLNRIGIVADDLHQAALVRGGVGGRRQAAIKEEDILCEGSEMMVEEGVFDLSEGNPGYWDPEASEGDPVDVAAGYVAFPYAAGIPPGCHLTETFLQRVVKKGDPRVLNTIVGRAIIQFKWDKFGKDKFLHKFAIYAVHVLLVSFQALVIGGTTITGPKDFAGRDGMLLVTSILMLLSTTLQAYREGRQVLSADGGIVSKVSSYLSDKWNYLDIGVVLSSYMAGTRGLFGMHVGPTYDPGYAGAFPDDNVVEGDREPMLVAMSAVACFLNWNKVLFFMRAFQGTGALVRMVVEISWDIRFLVMLVVVVNISASLSLFVLNSTMSTGFWDTILQVYAMMLGDFDLDGFDQNTHFPLLSKLVFVSFTLLQTILLLNLLIALMDERVQEKAISYTLLERAIIISEIENALNEAEREKFFPKWLHVLMPRTKLHDMKGGSGDGVDEDDTEWTGVAGSVKRVVGKIVEGNSNKLAQKMESKIDKLKADMRRLGDQVEKMTEGHRKQPITPDTVAEIARDLPQVDREKLIEELKKSLLPS